jgi:hypothetical protein
VRAATVTAVKTSVFQINVRYLSRGEKIVAKFSQPTKLISSV